MSIAPVVDGTVAPDDDDELWPGMPGWDQFIELEVETRELIAMLKYEVGLQWVSCAMRLQIEKIEFLIGERGTVPVVSEGKPCPTKPPRPGQD